MNRQICSICGLGISPGEVYFRAHVEPEVLRELQEDDAMIGTEDDGLVICRPCTTGFADTSRFVDRIA